MQDPSDQNFLDKAAAAWRSASTVIPHPTTADTLIRVLDERGYKPEKIRFEDEPDLYRIGFWINDLGDAQQYFENAAFVISFQEDAPYWLMFSRYFFDWYKDLPEDEVVRKLARLNADHRTAKFARDANGIVSMTLSFYATDIDYLQTSLDAYIGTMLASELLLREAFDGA